MNRAPAIAAGALVKEPIDERILGDSEFIEDVLSEQKERFERRYWLQSQGYDIDRVVQRVAGLLEIAAAEIWKPGNQPLRVKARSLVCYWAVRELGMSGTQVGKMLGIGPSAVRCAVARGEKFAQGMNLSLIDEDMHFFMAVPIRPWTKVPLPINAG